MFGSAGKSPYIQRPSAADVSLTLHPLALKIMIYGAASRREDSAPGRGLRPNTSTSNRTAPSSQHVLTFEHVFFY